MTKPAARLLDFGLAKPGVQLVGRGSSQLTTKGQLTRAGALGTLQYMAPEQLQAHPVDARTDVFAFGCVLYEMITGRHAFAGDTPAIEGSGLLIQPVRITDLELVDQIFTSWNPLMRLATMGFTHFSASVRSATQMRRSQRHPGPSPVLWVDPAAIRRLQDEWSGRTKDP
jgi:serine/threonine protein kinase